MVHLNSNSDFDNNLLWQNDIDINDLFRISIFFTSIGGYQKHYGFQGFPVTIPCTAFDINDGLNFMKIQWSKCVDCGEQWTIIGETHIISSPTKTLSDERFYEANRWRISSNNGDLITDNIVKSDEGLYRCDPTGPQSTTLQLLISG